MADGQDYGASARKDAQPSMTPYRFYSFIRIRPVGALDAFRLYIGYAASLLLRLTRLKHLLPDVQIPGAFIPSKKEMTVRVDGVNAVIRPRTTDLLIIAGLHEPTTSKWFDVKEGDTMIDVGAHIGRYTLLAAKSASQVIAVEPDPSNFSLLERNVKLNGFDNTILLNVALSDRPGERLLYPPLDEHTDTYSLEPNWRRDSIRDCKSSGKSVKCRTLDEITTTLGVEAVDWLKVDVEGHEVHVLEGAKATLGRTTHLVLEVSHGNEKRCKELLEQSGFRLVSSENDVTVSNWFLIRKIGIGERANQLHHSSSSGCSFTKM